VDDGVVSPALNRWLRRIGFALALAGCAYIGMRVWQGAAGVALRWPGPVPAAVAVACSTLAMAVLALGWYALMRACGEPVGLVAALRAYAISQPAKYLPGNVLHFAARHALGHADGGGHGGLLSAAALEAVSLIGMALLLAGIWARPEMFGVHAVARWAVMAAGGACLTTAIGYLALRRGGRGLAWLAAHFVAAAGYFVATTVAFGMLVGEAAPGLDFMLPVVSGSWVAGFVVIGAPGGLGVREATMMQLLGSETAAALLGAIISFRLVAVVADVCLFAATWWLPQASPAASKDP
jgi:hypothetical protein